MNRQFVIITLCAAFVLATVTSLAEAQTTVTYNSTNLPTFTPTGIIAINTTTSPGNMVITKAIGAPAGYQIANFLDAATLGTGTFTATMIFQAVDFTASPAGAIGLTCSNAVESDTSGRQVRVAYGAGAPPAGDQYLNSGGNGIAMGPYGTGTSADGTRIPLPTVPFRIQLERTSTQYIGRIDADNNGTFEITLGTVTLAPAARPIGLVIAGPGSFTVSSIQVTYTPAAPPTVPQATPSASAPTMSLWGLGVLAAVLGMVAVVSVRQWKARRAS